jgi:hypothetical protein
MTVHRLIPVTCCNCGVASMQQTLASTNQFGSADLDLRPPEMLRSTMSAWVQACPNCGYVAEEIGVEPLSNSIVRRVLKGERWRQLMTGWTGPDLASQFLRNSILLGELSRTCAAADSALYAAWVADDAGDSTLAIECRTEAARLMEQALELENLEVEARRRIRLRLVDVLRRTGSWRAAERYCDELLASSEAGSVSMVLRYQAHLIRHRNTTCQSISAALNWGGPTKTSASDIEDRAEIPDASAPTKPSRRWLGWLGR